MVIFRTKYIHPAILPELNRKSQSGLFANHHFSGWSENDDLMTESSHPAKMNKLGNTPITSWIFDSSELL